MDERTALNCRSWRQVLHAGAGASFGAGHDTGLLMSAASLVDLATARLGPRRTRRVDALPGAIDQGRSRLLEALFSAVRLFSGGR